MERQTHWEDIYATRAPNEVSWHKEHLEQSLNLIVRAGVSKGGQIIDVGGGDSTLVDDLLDRGYEHVTVLDISAAAIEQAKSRLGGQDHQVSWLVADVTEASLPYRHYDLWHDRAVFHFLTKADERRRYVSVLHHALKPGGHVIIATFAPDGPPRCSGLDVVRYSSDSLHNEFGDRFQLVESHREAHQTPFGSQQQFIYCYFKKRSS